MSPLMKVRLSLAALSLFVVGASQLYLKGIDAGLAQSDQEAFDAYTHFAKQMKHETRPAKAKPAKTEHAYTVSVWAAVDNH